VSKWKSFPVAFPAENTVLQNKKKLAQRDHTQFVKKNKNVKDFSPIRCKIGQLICSLENNWISNKATILFLFIFCRLKLTEK
jgi:hypothetical protein